MLPLLVLGCVGLDLDEQQYDCDPIDPGKGTESTCLQASYCCEPSEEGVEVSCWYELTGERYPCEAAPELDCGEAWALLVSAAC